MTGATSVLPGLTEDELDTLVSIAIRRAEILDEKNAPGASDVWHEVMIYEERLSAITRPEEVPGGIARVGAVRAGLAAGRREDASRLATLYLAEDLLPPERKTAIRRALSEDWERLSQKLLTGARTDERRAGLGAPWRRAPFSMLPAPTASNWLGTTSASRAGSGSYTEMRARPASQGPTSAQQPPPNRSQFGPDALGRD